MAGPPILPLKEGENGSNVSMFATDQNSMCSPRARGRAFSLKGPQQSPAISSFLYVVSNPGENAVEVPLSGATRETNGRGHNEGVHPLGPPKLLPVTSLSLQAYTHF